ncbi:hlh-6 [Pristionchus pacificus]|nr:hlh-6 [Pristionchus pacificus]
MAFIATPSFSNLYSTTATANLLSIASNVAQINADSGSNAVPSVSESTQDRKLLNPFDPKAIVPLPHQLDDQSGAFTTSVWKRNERERYRVRCVNEGYETLRHHLPLADGEKRISKVDTLRLAVKYVRHLEFVLQHPEHVLRCRCFDRFREESEGNVAIAIKSTGERLSC